MTRGKEGHKRVDLQERLDSRNATEPHLQEYLDTGLLTLPNQVHFEAFVQAIRRKESETHGRQDAEKKVGKLKWDLLAHLIGVVPSPDPTQSWEEQREWPLTKALEAEKDEPSARTIYTYMLVTFLHSPEKLPFSSVHILTDRVKSRGVDGLRTSLTDNHSQREILKDAKGKAKTIAYISAFTAAYPLVPTISQYEMEHQKPR